MSWEIVRLRGDTCRKLMWMRGPLLEAREYAREILEEEEITSGRFLQLRRD
jgi:hypothetical protein